MEQKELLLTGANRKLILSKVNTAQEFRELKDRWNLLLEKSSNPNIFLTWEWLFTWWELYGSGKELFILTLSNEAGDLLGIAPLCICKRRFLSLRQVCFLGTEEVCSDHLNFILCPGEEGSVLNQFLDYIYQQRALWDLVNLTDLPADSMTVLLLEEWAKKTNLVLSRTVWTICPYIVLPKSWEDFLKDLKKEVRQDIKRHWRKMENFENVSFSVVQDTDEFNRGIQSLFELHSKRWGIKGESGVFTRERFNRFHLKVADLFLKNKWLFLSCLTVMKKPIAIEYRFVYKDKLIGYQKGFDPDWSGFSPGTVSFIFTLKEAIQRGFLEYDLLRGDAAYKYRWTDKDRRNLKILIWNKNLKSAFYRNTGVFINKAKKSAKRFLPDTVIKILKPLWQRLGITGE